MSRFILIGWFARTGLPDVRGPLFSLDSFRLEPAMLLGKLAGTLGRPYNMEDLMSDRWGVDIREKAFSGLANS